MLFEVGFREALSLTVLDGLQPRMPAWQRTTVYGHAKKASASCAYPENQASGHGRYKEI
jgi:hypothetical protein